MAKARITEIREWTDLTPKGEFEHYMRVEFETEKGFKGTIDIKKTEFTAETAQALVAQKALELDATIGAEVSY